MLLLSTLCNLTARSAAKPVTVDLHITYHGSFTASTPLCRPQVPYDHNEEDPAVQVLAHGRWRLTLFGGFRLELGPFSLFYCVFHTAPAVQWDNAYNGWSDEILRLKRKYPRRIQTLNKREGATPVNLRE
jgi:hypothetical protein